MHKKYKVPGMVTVDMLSVLVMLHKKDVAIFNKDSLE